MLRKCTVGLEHRPAFFHGWFPCGNLEGGIDPVAVVEFEDGTTSTSSSGYIFFDTPPTAETVESANLHQPTALL
jgi:hypothetical protein